MFNNYVEMLKKTTEAMTSLHHTEAGPAEYFSAVGYEFAVIMAGSDVRAPPVSAEQLGYLRRRGRL